MSLFRPTGPAAGRPGGFPAKFNAAFSLGGPQLLVKQVEQVTGLPVDHFLSIDFAGFQSMVDALGGVTVCLSQAAYDPGVPGVTGGSGFHASAGVHRLNGVQALQYVRQRDGLPHGDLDRIQRQQRFLSAIVRQAKSPSVLLNPFKLGSFVSAIARNVSRDSGTSESALLSLATKLKGLSTSGVEFNTVPIARAVTSHGSLGDYLVMDPVKSHVLFHDIHDDIDPAAPRPQPKPRTAGTGNASSTAVPVTPLTVPPADITLTVTNGSGITGKAAAVSAMLHTLGYHVDDVNTQARSNPAPTLIEYGSTELSSAQTLAAAIPGSRLTPSANPAQKLTLVLGTSFSTPHAVTVTSRQTAPTQASPPSVPASAQPSNTPPKLAAPLTAAGTAAVPNWEPSMSSDPIPAGYRQPSAPCSGTRSSPDTSRQHSATSWSLQEHGRDE